MATTLINNDFFKPKNIPNQYFGFNTNAWNFFNKRVYGWMWIQKITFANGWLKVHFTDEFDSEHLTVRISKQELPRRVLELLGDL